jgi:PKD repeat protein
VTLNTPPVAAFTATPNELTVALDAAGSSDPDGTISSYAWDFGDSTTGTGARPSKTYASAGTYQVRLTVTDNDGGTASTTKPVTVTAPVTVIAEDTFNRTVSNGWGTATTGGAWTTTNTAANFAVSAGTGRITVPTAGSTRAIYLGSASSSDADVQVGIAVDKAATGGGTYVSVIGRRVASQGDYRAKLRLVAGGSARLSITHVSSGNVETVIVPETAVPGLTVAAGERVNVRLQATGTGSTALRAKAWKAGTTEPATWLVTGTNALSGMQTAGSFGLVAYLSGSSTNAPHVVSFSGFRVARASALP